MAFWDDWIKNRIQGEIDDLLKSDGITTEGVSAPSAKRGAFNGGDVLPDEPENHDASNQIGRKAIIDDPYFTNMANQVNYKHRRIFRR